MDTAILFPNYTELGAIRDKLSITKAFELIDLGNIPLEEPRNFIVDMTFDFYNSDTTPQFLFETFAKIFKTLEEIYHHNITVIVARGIPFKCNVKKMTVRQRILEHFIEMAREFFHAKILTLPTIISRYTLKKLQNPCVRIIESVMNDESEKIKFKPDCQFNIIYGMDLLHFLLDRNKAVWEKNVIVEGVFLRLEEMLTITQKIAGHTPLSFDSRNHIEFDYEDIFSETVREMNYNFEAMMIDMVSSLF